MLCHISVTGGAASTFSIDQSSAEIRLVTALDYETTTSYVIVVVATDGGGSVVRTFAFNSQKQMLFSTFKYRDYIRNIEMYELHYMPFSS